MGVKPENIFIDDLREEFVRDFVFPMFRANTLYEGQYLLGTSIARPLIAKSQIEIANLVGADAVCHGATGKGNDQVRFEVSYYALKPDVTIIAPWREWELRGPARADRLRQEARHRDRQGQGARRAVLDRRQSAAHVERRTGAGRPRRRSARHRHQARRSTHDHAGRSARSSRDCHPHRFERGDLSPSTARQ